MFWRLLSALAVLFWAVMAALLVRDTYFPQHAEFNAVPPRYIFDLFLKQAAQQAVTLHLQHRGEKIGHASLAISSRADTTGQRQYDLMARGHIERLQDHSERLDVTWEITGLIDSTGSWSRVALIARMPQEKIDARITWQHGEPTPAVQVTQAGQPLIDSAQLSMIHAFSGSLLGKADSLTALLGPLQQAASASQQQPSSTQPSLTAHEAAVTMAGRDRKCFVIIMPLLAAQTARLIFAETGELARVELPQDYLLLEPMIHGMFSP